MPTDPPIIKYATPQPSQSKGGKFALDVATVVVVAFVFLLILPAPYDHYDWHFGHHPQWHVAFDFASFSIGHTGESSIYIPAAGLLFMKLLVVSVPAWLIRRILRRRQSWPPAPPQNSDSSASHRDAP